MRKSSVVLAGCGFSIVAVTLVWAAGPSAFAVSYASGNPSVLRDNQASQFQLVPPAPTVAHSQVIEPDTQIEPSIAVNPADPMNAVTGFQEGRVPGGGDETNGFAATFDGGQTWTRGEIPGLTYLVGGTGGCSPVMTLACDRASDAAVAFGPNNTVYFNSLVFDDGSNQGLCSGITVNVSTTGGATWGPPVFLQSDCLGGTNDKNWIVVDNGTGPGHHLGRVYVVWDRIAPIVYNYCDPDSLAHAPGCDKAADWLPNFLQIQPAQGIGAIPLVLKDGSLGVVYSSITNVPVAAPGDQPELAVGPLVWALAPLAGTASTWPAALTFTQTALPITSDNGSGGRYQRAATGLESADVDQSTGTVYVGWDDNRFRTESATSPVADPVIIHSTDPTNEGLTWSTVRRVDYNESTTDYMDRYNTMVAFGSSGVLRVAYLQRQEDADPNTNGSGFSPIIDTYYQESHDGGATFTAPLKVDTNQASNFYYGAFSRNGLFEGDYNELASGGSLTYIVREAAYPTSQNEPVGLKFYPGAGPTNTGTTPHYEGDYSSCPQVSGQPVISPSCLTHLHQRTWVAVLGPSPAGNIPDARYVVVLALIGVGVAGFEVGRRRRRSHKVVLP
jgi:hypothetical protein